MDSNASGRRSGTQDRPVRGGQRPTSGTIPVARPRDGKDFDAPVGRLLENSADADGLPRATASGSALALNLWAWGRGAALEHLADGPDTVEIQGDPEAVQQLAALIAQGHD